MTKYRCRTVCRELFAKNFCGGLSEVGKKTDSDSQTEKILRYRRLIYPESIVNVSQSEISAFNSAELLRKRKLRKILRPRKKNITVDSFIVPVSDNASISAYLFRKQSGNADMLNSLIIYLHDGGWVFGNMDLCNAVCSNICDYTGVSVLALDYRLAPVFRFPIPAEDCFNAYQWAVQGARYWKKDPSRIYVMGSCAGGNLAIAVCRLARDRKTEMPAGLILINPITDCRLKTNSIEKHKNDSMLSERELNTFISYYMREPKDILNPLFSPMLAPDNSRFPETLIFASEEDPLFDDAKLYSLALTNADTPCKLMTTKGSSHFMINFPTLKTWSDTMNVIKNFICGINTVN